MRSPTLEKPKRDAGYISKELVYILWGVFWGEPKVINLWWARPKSKQYFTVLGQVITDGIRATLVSVLSMWVRVQLSLGESWRGGANLSAKSRQIPCGGANLSEDVESIKGVYVTTHLEMRSPISAKHNWDVGYISKELIYILWDAF